MTGWARPYEGKVSPWCFEGSWVTVMYGGGRDEGGRSVLRG